MLKRLVTWTGCMAWCALAVLTAQAEEAQPVENTRQIGDLAWHTNYGTAYRQARDEHKQLLLFFRDEKDLLTAGQLEQNVLAKPELKATLSKMVRAMIPTTAMAPLPKDAKPITKWDD